MSGTVQQARGLFVTERTASREYRCVECGDRIEAGARYIEHRAAAWYSYGFRPNEGWSVLASHAVHGPMFGDER